MNNKKDLIGMKFGKLTVVSKAENDKKNQAMWNCLCDCGNYTRVCTYQLTSGKTKSCGCLRKIAAHENHFDDLTGKTFGKLTVIRRAENKEKRTMWECLCECGNISIVEAYQLKQGFTKSCGCLRYESRNSTHGMSRTRIFTIWSKMIDRCTNENNPAYKWYGERGIKVFDEWRTDFVSFYNWAKNNGYNENLTLERIDVNGNYEPQNCKWIPLNEQPLNTRKTKYLTYKGERKTVSEWSKITGIKKNTLLNRINSGYTDEECIDVPLCSRRGKKRK